VFSLNLLQVHPVLSRVRSQREHLHTRWHVSFCANLAAEFNGGLPQLFDVSLSFCVASSLSSSAKGKREGGKCIAFSW
jgi:hypothetical protein